MTDKSLVGDTKQGGISQCSARAQQLQELCGDEQLRACAKAVRSSAMRGMQLSKLNKFNSAQSQLWYFTFWQDAFPPTIGGTVLLNLAALSEKNSNNSNTESYFSQLRERKRRVSAPKASIQILEPR